MVNAHKCAVVDSRITNRKLKLGAGRGKYCTTKILHYCRKYRKESFTDITAAGAYRGKL